MTDSVRTLTLDKKIFSTPSDRGFTVTAYYLLAPHEGDALVEIFNDGKPYRRFLYPAYKVWNIAAHFDDIVTSEIEGNMQGYDSAGWTGFSVIHPEEV